MIVKRGVSARSCGLMLQATPRELYSRGAFFFSRSWRGRGEDTGVRGGQYGDDIARAMSSVVVIVAFANTERKKRTIYFPTLDCAPVSENKKVRF